MGGREGGEIDPWRLGHCPMDREKIEEKTEKQRSRGEEAKRRAPARPGGGKELNLEVAVPSFIQSVL